MASLPNTQLVHGQGLLLAQQGESYSISPSERTTWYPHPPIMKGFNLQIGKSSTEPGSQTVSPVSENENIIGTTTPLEEKGATKKCINDDDEESPLLSIQNNTKCSCIQCSKTARKILIATLIIIISILIFFAAVCIIFPLVHPLSSSGSELAVGNDTILVACKSNWFIIHKIQFFIHNETNSQMTPDKVALIFIVPLETLYQIIDARVQLLHLPVSSNYTSLIRLETTEQFFANCSDYPGICILEQFLYFVNSGSASISFMITLSSFVKEETQVRISVYDNLDSFKSYLEGSEDKPLKEKFLTSKKYLFDLTSEEMTKSSYIFIVLEDVKSTVTSFTYTTDGLVSYYNASSLQPVCRLDNSNSYQCTVTMKRSTCCFLAQVQVEGSSKSSSRKDLVYINHSTKDFKLSIAGIFFFFLSGLFIVICFIGVAGVIYCCVKYKKMLRTPEATVT